MPACPDSIVIVTSDFVQTGGMDIANYALAENFARRGNAVHVVGFRVAEPLASLAGVVWHRVPKPLRSYTLALPLLDYHGRRVAREIAARGGRVIVNGGNCWWGDVNWVHYVHAAHKPVSGASTLRHWVGQSNHSRWLNEEKRALLDARLVIANSERTRSDVIHFVGVPEERVQTIYYGIEAEKFRPADEPTRLQLRQQFAWHIDRPVAIFVGALGDRRKGFDILFEAWRKVCDNPAWNVDLVVVGHGAELPAWRRRVFAAGLADRIYFLGFRQDVNNLLRAADLLVSPTRYEAYGLGVHEALCCGIPAIVTETAGVAERYPTNLRCLLLSDPPEVDALATSLSEWLDRREVMAPSVAMFSEQLRSWSWTNMAEQFQLAIGSNATR